MYKYTKQGYSYLPVTREEMLSWGGLAVCDSCNQNMSHGYLIYILNSCYCARCFNEWQERAHHYPEDLQLQERYQDKWYQYHLQNCDKKD